jgi:hypothetical protein
MEDDVGAGQLDAREAGQVGERLAFISHKERDAELAALVGGLLRKLSGMGVELYLSSSVQHKGPRFGESIPDGLRKALGRSGLVVLVYTDPTDNWEWCLWECGVATDPNDETPTRVGVFSFGDAPPKPYESSLNVVISTADQAARERTVRSLEAFALDFCKGEQFWPDGGGAIAPRINPEEIKEIVEDFVEDFDRLPRFDSARGALIEATKGLDPDAANLLVPLVKSAVEAIGWGLSAGPQRALFDECWESVYVQDLRKLSQRVLVFRPPTVTRFWERLIELGSEVWRAELPAPWIRLVSGEDRDDPLEFWFTAMTQGGADSRSYEEPLRDTAAQLAAMAGRNVVERRFLLDQGYFHDDPVRVERFEAIAKWMNDAAITVSVARRSDAPGTRWADFALVGDVAVSRFESVQGLTNRVLEENFSSEEIARADEIWRSQLVPRWTSGGNEAFAAYLERKQGWL